MTEPTATSTDAPPRCQRCRAPLVRTEMPPSVFGIEGEVCVDCNDATPTRLVPWRCLNCGAVYLFEAVGASPRPE